MVLLDDIASSGHTLAQAARLLLRSGARSVDVAVTHALFSGDALQVVREAGVGHIWSTDSVPHESNCIGLAGLLAAALLVSGCSKKSEITTTMPRRRATS